MNEQVKINLLRKKMTKLREENHYSLSKLSLELKAKNEVAPMNKSILSRIENTSINARYSNVKKYAKKYCDFFCMDTEQQNLFFRIEKGVVVDQTALLNIPSLIFNLIEEYCFVCIPSFVEDELKSIKKNNTHDRGYIASELLKNIKNLCDRYSERVLIRDYNIPTSSECMIVDIAKEFLKESNCKKIDIISGEKDIAVKCKRQRDLGKDIKVYFINEFNNTKLNLGYLRELNAINEYYADSYDNIEKDLRINNLSEINMNAYVKNGETLITAAVKNKDKPVNQRIEKIRWLIKNGADINIRANGNNYFPPLTYAIEIENYELFSFLLYECKADPNVGSKNPNDLGRFNEENNGNMPLMVAAYKNQVKMVSDLCNDERTSLNQQDSNGYTALMKASDVGSTECINIILETGADPKIIDLEGNTYQDHFNNSSGGGYEE